MVSRVSPAVMRLAVSCICCGAAVSADVDSPPPHAVDLSVHGRASATPSVAAAGDLLAVAWSASLPGGVTDVFAAVSRDGGRSFGAPVRVNDVDGDARVTGEQPPRIAVAGSVLTVVWTAKGANGTRLLQSRSTDGGKTFAKSTVVPGSDAAGNRGWENTTVDRRGRVFVVWLDHRELARQDGEVAAGHHDHAAHAAAAGGAKPDGVAMAQRSKLFIGSLDGEHAPRAITGGVCYCCKTALASGGDGAIYSAWRHVYPGNIRDIAFTMSRDGGATFRAPVRVSEDRWQLEGCPDDGPAMAIDSANRVHIVWPTLVSDGGDETIALFYATSSDGASFTPRQRIPASGMPHHPQIAIASDGSPVVAWDEAANGRRTAAIARRASPSAAFGREVLAAGAVYPVIVPVGDAIAAVWTSGRGDAAVIRVEVRR